MDQSETTFKGNCKSGRTGGEVPALRGKEWSWSEASANRLLAAHVREGVPPVLFDGVNRELVDLVRKVETLPLSRGLKAEKLREARALLVKTAHSMAVQSEVLSELRLLALTDDLTGLYNRRGFLFLALQQLKVSRRRGQPMLLFFMDVDQLKATNDHWGHDEGDALLLRCAAVLNDTFRESDLLARLGGDEFAVLAAEGADKTSSAMIERLDKAIRDANMQASPATLSLSFGMARYDPQAPVSLAELLTAADCAMYRHKRERSGAEVTPHPAVVTEAAI